MEPNVPNAHHALRRTARLRSPAKVNLHLEVLRHRRDGFHEIETILQAVKIFDEIEVTYDPAATAGSYIGIAVEPHGAAPANEANLCWMAADLFRRETGITGSFNILLKKEIPSAAGLGGASGNAAAVLLACDRLCGTGLGIQRLEQMGGEIGTDVPFFFRGGTQLGRGRGNDLTRLTPIQQGRFVIIRPHIDLSTSQVYNRLNMGLTRRRPTANIRTVESLIARFPTGSWFGINRLEEVVLPDHPVLQRLLQHLKDNAPVAMLSGSGSAVFAVVPNGTKEPKLLEGIVSPGWFLRTVKPHSTGVEFMEEQTTRLNPL